MIKKPNEILKEIIAKYTTMREFCKKIDEDAADVFLWKRGTRKIHPRAVIKICYLHPEIKPYQLNKLVFPKDLKLVFGEKHE